MAAIDDPKTLGRARLSFASDADIDEFVATLAKFEEGELTPDQWRVFRLVRGTYGQRQAGDSSMLRVKIPQGYLTVDQLHALADIADQYSRGFGHVTTRQNMQFHFMKLHEVELAMRRAAEAGLTTREACGNSVRNITACPYAGVAADEVFDVTPYSEALTRYLLRHPLSSVLPRKFKIGFEGCPEDHTGTAINDIGWQARLGPDGERGFRVTVGGGTSILVSSGHVLYDFVPATAMLEVAEAIIRVYHQLGDYQHKQRNRMKFLIKAIGWDVFRQHFEEALVAFRAEGGARLNDADLQTSDDEPTWDPTASPEIAEVAATVATGATKGPGIHPVVAPRTEVTDAAFERWRATNTRPQKQTGYTLVTATVPLGDLTAAQMRVVADLALAYGDGTVRTTVGQDLVFRWVRTSAVRELYGRLAAASLGLAEAGTIADVTSCPGAESCRLAVTQSRGLGRTLETHLRARPDLINAAQDAAIKISGCPNGCGLHHIATIGFQGSVRKLGTKVVPQYFVMVGGGVRADGASFGRLSAKIPARRAADALERLIELYQAERNEGESARDFFRRVDLARVKYTLRDLEQLKEEDAIPEDFIDLGEDTAFNPEVMEGECSA